jgi:hypothetical protein
MQQQEQQHPAMQAAAAGRPASSGRDARTELQRKEHELAQLRVAALQSLEQQVRRWRGGRGCCPLLCAPHSRRCTTAAAACCRMPAQLAESQAQCAAQRGQLEELKADFQYNLQLLAERDAELEQADAAASAAGGELAAKAAAISQLQAQLAQTQSGEALAALQQQPMRRAWAAEPANPTLTELLCCPRSSKHHQTWRRSGAALQTPPPATAASASSCSSSWIRSAAAGAPRCWSSSSSLNGRTTSCSCC